MPRINVDRKQFDHDRDSEVDYIIDWSRWLLDTDGDIVASAEWDIFPEGAGELYNQSNTMNTTTIWLRDVVEGIKRVYLRCRMTTNDGRVQDETLVLTIKNN